MDTIQLQIKDLSGFISEEDILKQSAQAAACNQALHDGSREGNDFLGWVTLPSSNTDEVLREIEDAATVLRNECGVQ